MSGLKFFDGRTISVKSEPSTGRLTGLTQGLAGISEVDHAKLLNGWTPGYITLKQQQPKSVYSNTDKRWYRIEGDSEVMERAGVLGFKLDNVTQAQGLETMLNALEDRVEVRDQMIKDQQVEIERLKKSSFGDLGDVILELTRRL